MLNYNKEKIAFSRSLRKNMTSCEKKLWYLFLRNYPVKFRRQKIIGDFIADFYCAKAHLIIEVDGEGHQTLQAEIDDAIRTMIISKQHFRVVRVSNDLIENSFYEVCEYLDKIIQLQINGIE